MLNKYIENIENMMKEMSAYEKQGLDTSSLRLFLKNLKTFSKLQRLEYDNSSKDLSFNEKLDIIKNFLEDKKAFPRIIDVINFANDKLSLGFKDQKGSRDLTIKRILGRIDETPYLKDKVREAVFEIIKQKGVHQEFKNSKKDKESIESFSKWAEILRNL